jgi:uncharacterized protein
MEGRLPDRCRHIITEANDFQKNIAMHLTVLDNKYSIYRFPHESRLPDWIYLSEFYSVTRTSEELSVVAVQNETTGDEIMLNKDWRIIKVEGPLDFSLTGIISGISSILSSREISIFAISTYDTDYILVKQSDLNCAVKALEENGYIIS